MISLCSLYSCFLIQIWMPRVEFMNLRFLFILIMFTYKPLFQNCYPFMNLGFCRIVLCIQSSILCCPVMLRGYFSCCLSILMFHNLVLGHVESSVRIAKDSCDLLVHGSRHFFCKEQNCKHFRLAARYCLSQLLNFAIAV